MARIGPRAPEDRTPPVPLPRSPPSQYSTRLPCRCSPSRTVKRRKDCSPGLHQVQRRMRGHPTGSAPRRWFAADHRLLEDPVAGDNRSCSLRPRGSGPPNLGGPELPRSKEPPHTPPRAAQRRALSLKAAPSAPRQLASTSRPSPRRPPGCNGAPILARAGANSRSPTCGKSTRRECREWERLPPHRRIA